MKYTLKIITLSFLLVGAVKASITEFDESGSASVSGSRRAPVAGMKSPVPDPDSQSLGGKTVKDGIKRIARLEATVVQYKVVITELELQITNLTAEAHEYQRFQSQLRGATLMLGLPASGDLLSSVTTALSQALKSTGDIERLRSELAAEKAARAVAEGRVADLIASAEAMRAKLQNRSPGDVMRTLGTAAARVTRMESVLGGASPTVVVGQRDALRDAVRNLRSKVGLGVISPSAPTFTSEVLPKLDADRAAAAATLAAKDSLQEASVAISREIAELRAKYEAAKRVVALARDREKERALAAIRDRMTAAAVQANVIRGSGIVKSGDTDGVEEATRELEARRATLAEKNLSSPESLIAAMRRKMEAGRSSGGSHAPAMGGAGARPGASRPRLPSSAASMAGSLASLGSTNSSAYGGHSYMKSSSRAK